MNLAIIKIPDPTCSTRAPSWFLILDKIDLLPSCFCLSRPCFLHTSACHPPQSLRLQPASVSLNCAGSRLCDSRMIHRGETAFQQSANIRAPSAAGPLKLFGHRSQSYVHMLYVDSFAAHSSRTSILKSTSNSLTYLLVPTPAQSDKLAAAVSQETPTICSTFVSTFPAEP